MVLAGCATSQDGARYPPACNGDGPALWGAFDIRTPTAAGMNGPETDPRRSWSTVVAIHGDPSFAVAPVVGNATVTPVGNGTERLAIVEFPPGQDYVDFTVLAEGVDCVRFGGGAWRFSPAREGATVEVGKGALVKAAGFWENGTLFYTNMHEVDDGPRDGNTDESWPRAGWYEYGGDDALPVYVYDKDRSEAPPAWTAGNEVPDEDPFTGFVVPGRYFTTIPGFNEALKGLSTSTTVAVRIPPELAYTRPGNEEHPLYGDALVFLIHVEAVADLPCAPSDGEVAGAACFRK